MKTAELHIGPTLPFLRIWAIALTTLTELIRSRVFYFLGIFALIVLGAGAFLSDFSFAEQIKVLKDTSLGSISIFTTVLAIAATAMLIPNDVEDRTLYTILAKPITRFEYLLGKLLGVFMLLAVLVLLMTAVFSVILFWKQQEVLSNINEVYAQAAPEVREMALREARENIFTVSLGLGVILIYIKSCLIATICLAVSTIAQSAIFTILTTVAIYFIGAVQGVARAYWLEKAILLDFVEKIFVKSIGIIFPDLSAFNLSDEINAGTPLPPEVFWGTAGLGLMYILVYLIVAFIIFSKKEL